jgi:hypothetical protein
MDGAAATSPLVCSEDIGVHMCVGVRANPQALLGCPYLLRVAALSGDAFVVPGIFRRRC